MNSIKTGMVQFPSNSHTTPGYLARPDGGNKHPGIVVIQEWWGLVPHIEDIAGRLAREGFIALAPDLYDGKRADEPDEARKLVMAMDRGRAVSEILAAATYLGKMDTVAPKKVGVIGWCMGGGLALSTAAEDGNIGAAVAFYGRPLDASDTARLHVPILGLYAGQDHSIPPETIHEFERELEQNRVPHEIHIYPSAHHAFFNDTRQAYKPDAAQDAWKRTLGWFRANLRQ